MHKYLVRTVALHITQVCTHHCPFCYATSSLKVAHPPYEKIHDILLKIASEGVENVVFLGGDPCEYPWLLDLCGIAKDRGMSTLVLSNTQAYQDIGKAVSVVDVFETTFHGPTANEHDAIAMVDGAFERVICNLGALAERDARSIGVVYNVTPANADLLYDTVSALIDRYRIPVDHLLIQRIIPQGRARATAKFSIGQSHILSVMSDLERIYDRYAISIAFEDPVPFCIVPQRYHRFLNRCQWGFTHCAVNWQGDLSRCGSDPRYSLGNILENSLTEIWNTSPVLQSFRSREYLPEECRRCDLLEVCGGGCALSCELDSDHSIDYLFFEHLQKTEPRGPMSYRQAHKSDLSSILRIEWACFPDYEFKFSAASLSTWYSYNPSMFYVLENHDGIILGYTCIVPLTHAGFSKIRNGKASSLTELEPNDVIKGGQQIDTPYWHVEVVATVSNAEIHAGAIIIRELANYLLAQKAKVVVTSPITPEGMRICRRLGFTKVATQTTEHGSFDIYLRERGDNKGLATIPKGSQNAKRF